MFQRTLTRPLRVPFLPQAVEEKRNKAILAGTVGFEPTHAGIKTPCLTTWRRPNELRSISEDDGF
jgi:hypothetical protein